METEETLLLLWLIAYIFPIGNVSMFRNFVVNIVVFLINKHFLLQAGQFIIEYCGEVISWKEARRRSQAYEAEGKGQVYSILFF